MNYLAASGESRGHDGEEPAQEPSAVMAPTGVGMDGGAVAPAIGEAAVAAPVMEQAEIATPLAGGDVDNIGGSERAPAVRGPHHALWPLGVGAGVLVVDQTTKEWVVRSLVEDQEGASWLGGNLSLIHVNNDGAAFGLLAGQMFLFVLIALVVAAVVVAYYRFLPRERLWLRISLGLQLGGALGNLLDRLRHGYVVDFVEIRTLPVFNVADAAIVCGVLILAYYLLVHLDAPARPAAEGTAARRADEGGEPHGAPPAS